MQDNKISTLLAFSLLSAPLASTPPTPSNQQARLASLPVSQRAALRKMQYRLAPAPVLEPMGTYVGELQEKWQFPSDHLPIGMTFEDLHMMSWNVLDNAYISWVLQKNSQGLSRSMIADEHVYIPGSQITLRDRHVIDLILQTLSHPLYPRSLLALQECGEPFLAALRQALPAHFEVVSCHGEAIILDRRRFDILSMKEIKGIFSDEPHRTIQDLHLRRLDNGQEMRLVNGHLPGDPTKPGRLEFAQYLQRTFDPQITTLAMGDMNFNELEMAEAMNQAFQGRSPFSMHSPYPTNISPFEFRSKAIDHFFVYSPNGSSATLHEPNQLMDGLDATLHLLTQS